MAAAVDEEPLAPCFCATAVVDATTHARMWDLVPSQLARHFEVRTIRGTQRGLFTKKKLSAGGFLGEYCGEVFEANPVVTPEQLHVLEVNTPVKVWSVDGSCTRNVLTEATRAEWLDAPPHRLTVDTERARDSDYILLPQDPDLVHTAWGIDAKHLGNYTRFINHSHAPSLVNCAVVRVNDSLRDLPPVFREAARGQSKTGPFGARTLFLLTRDVAAGEQLLFMYNTVLRYPEESDLARA